MPHIESRPRRAVAHERRTEARRRSASHGACGQCHAPGPGGVYRPAEPVSPQGAGKPSKLALQTFDAALQGLEDAQAAFDEILNDLLDGNR
jgi:mono/diheme cytochrome c family protein